ncbi:MAG: hypothetical protein A3J24_06700 [Deltaproteobacteria bacterium RIFCSPLOWO2_02_FULL_53_8]|nr:MAG: hypothetical protein A3J24_06700 [Deltaproteobacteria bacterium RIFCSPLOWO2_02_FULL_53_8]
MSRDASYLLDILLYAKDAAEFTTDMNKEAFLSDPKCQFAVIRCLEVIGEAAKHGLRRANPIYRLYFTSSVPTPLAPLIRG